MYITHKKQQCHLNPLKKNKGGGRENRTHGKDKSIHIWLPWKPFGAVPISQRKEFSTPSEVIQAQQQNMQHTLQHY